MKRSHFIGVAFGSTVVLLLGFQNCSQVHFSPNADSAQLASVSSAGDPSGGNPGGGGSGGVPGGNPGGGTTLTTNSGNNSLTATAMPSTVTVGGSTSLSITQQGLTAVTYSCVDQDNQSVIASGEFDLLGPVVSVPVETDLICTVTGVDGSDPSSTPLTVEVPITVDCANQVKDGAKCVDFACNSVQVITISQLNSIPARSSAGVCYAMKLMSAIKNSASNLTTTTDPDVVSANHDVSQPANHNPYLMGKYVGQFMLAGPRTVKLAGGVDASTPILVDNFVLYGVYPTSTASPVDVSKYYQAMGTADAPEFDLTTGKRTNGVLLDNVNIPVQAFASGGTSSLAPINLSVSVPANVLTTLDVRAEDCGGSRQLSDIYLLFQ